MAAYLFVQFFAAVLHDHNVKLPRYTLYGGKDVCVPVRIFLSLRLFFARWVAASFSHFPTAVIKSSCFSSNNIRLLCFSSLPLALFLLFTSVLVCYTAVFSVVTQRSWGGTLRDDTKNGCVADYLSVDIKI